MADSNYTISIDFNTCNSSWASSGEVWIDYNINSVFEPNESIGTWNGNAPSGIQNFNFTVPSWVCNGNTRIRMKQEESGTTPLDPCSGFTWGSVIDATIILSGGSCQISGCTDSTSANFNPLATLDDGSCLNSPGVTCSNSFAITLPFNATNQNTSNMGNPYTSSDACGSTFMNGNDFVMEYIPTNDTCVQINISNADFSTGAFLVKGCPDSPISTCISVGDGSNFDFIGEVEADSTYYIIISSDGFPNVIDYSINIQELICPVPDSQDCNGGVRICQDYFEPNFFPGDGSIPDEVPNNSCLSSGEKNAVWYQFTSYQDGVLGFTIFPNTPDDDYDWAVYDISNGGCAGVPTGSSPELSCNYAPNVCPPPGGDGSTGPNGDLTGPCAGQNEDLIPVDSGGTYAIVVSQFTDASQDGFTIVFDSNGVISANSIDAEDQMINCGQTAVLEANFGGPVDAIPTYIWSPANSLNDSTLENPTTIPLDTSISFPVTVINGQCVLEDTVHIEIVNNLSTNPLGIDANCGDTLILDANYSGNQNTATYSWSPAEFLNDNSLANPTTIRLDTSVLFYVSINNGICTNYDTLRVNIENPDYAYLPEDTFLCFGQEVMIIPEVDSTINKDLLTYLWSPSTGLSSTTDSTPTVSVTQDITYIVRISQGGICEDIDTINIRATDSLVSNIDFFINDNFDIDGIAEVEFYNLSVGTSPTFSWDFGDDTDIIDEEAPFHIYKDEGTYLVNFIITDTLGCVDSSSLEVEIPLLEIPNIFTPNNDGVNDVFKIKRIRSLSTLTIYNRWGKKVYEDLNYQNDWDGGDLQDGTYFAELSYQRGNEIQTYKAWFDIKR